MFIFIPAHHVPRRSLPGWERRAPPGGAPRGGGWGGRGGGPRKVCLRPQLGPSAPGCSQAAFPLRAPVGGTHPGTCPCPSWGPDRFPEATRDRAVGRAQRGCWSRLGRGDRLGRVGFSLGTARPQSPSPRGRAPRRGGDWWGLRDSASRMGVWGVWGLFTGSLPRRLRCRQETAKKPHFLDVRLLCVPFRSAPPGFGRSGLHLSGPGAPGQPGARWRVPLPALPSLGVSPWKGWREGGGVATLQAPPGSFLSSCWELEEPKPACAK